MPPVTQSHNLIKAVSINTARGIPYWCVVSQKEQDPQNHIFLMYLLASEDTEKMKLKEVLITLKAQAIGD
jgi:hypothetical protein